MSIYDIVCDIVLAIIGAFFGSIFGQILIYKVVHPYIGVPYLRRRQKLEEQKQNSIKEL